MFYTKFEKLCYQNGISKSKVAEAIGISSNNVTLWKRGSVPNPKNLKKIADYFGVPVDYFFEDEIKEKANSPTEREGMKRKIDRLSDENFERFTQLLKLSMPEIFEDK